MRFRVAEQFRRVLRMYPRSRGRRAATAADYGRICVLGSAVAYGYNLAELGGFRISLEDRLVEGGHTYSLVGGQTNGPAELVDQDFDGFLGNASFFPALIPGMFAVSGPWSVVVLAVTASNVFNGSVATLAADLTAVFAAIYTAAPQVRVLALETPDILPVNDYGANPAHVTAARAALSQAVADQAGLGRSVELVTIPDYGAAYIGADGFFPSRAGYDYLAGRIYGVLTHTQT